MSIPALLVSVRNVAEARAAVEGGCDRLDVKEPLRGPLGMADAGVISQIAAFSTRPQGRNSPLPCSVALGELDEWSALGGQKEDDEPASFPDGVTDIKLGPAHLDTPNRWFEGWRESLRRFPSRTGFPTGTGTPIRRVAVAYADWKLARALPPEQILVNAIDVGCNAFLVDTYQKDGGCLLDALAIRDLERLSVAVRRTGMTLALAGSVGLEHLPMLVDARPDVIAVRGAACEDRCRSGAISSVLVRRLKTAIAERFAG